VFEMEAFSKGTFAIAKTLAEITEKVRQSELPVGNTRTLVGRTFGRIVLPHRTALASATESVLGRNPTAPHSDTSEDGPDQSNCSPFECRILEQNPCMFCSAGCHHHRGRRRLCGSCRAGRARRQGGFGAKRILITCRGFRSRRQSQWLPLIVHPFASWRRGGCCWTDTLPDMQPFLPLGTKQERARIDSSCVLCARPTLRVYDCICVMLCRSRTSAPAAARRWSSSRARLCQVSPPWTTRRSTLKPI